MPVLMLKMPRLFKSIFPRRLNLCGPVRAQRQAAVTSAWGPWAVFAGPFGLARVRVDASKVSNSNTAHLALPFDRSIIGPKSSFSNDSSHLISTINGVTLSGTGPLISCFNA